MSEERPVVHIPKMGGTKRIGLNKAREIAENQEELTDAELEARLAKVLERGIIIDRTTIDMPDGVYGEWVSDEAAEISRMQLMGFELDTTIAKDRATHSDGAGEVSRIGDVVFMTCPRRVKDTIDKVKRQMYERANPKKGSQKEEKDYKQLMGRETSLPVTDESTMSEVGEEGIIAALEGKNE